MHACKFGEWGACIRIFLNWQYIMIFFFEENNKVVENGK